MPFNVQFLSKRSYMKRGSVNASSSIKICAVVDKFRHDLETVKKRDCMKWSAESQCVYAHSGAMLQKPLQHLWMSAKDGSL
jgi:hypothetical protein